MKNDKKMLMCQNKKAYHEYFISETYEAGIVLTGTEIKSIRLGKVSITESYCSVRKGQMIIQNMHISKYDQGNIFNHDPDQDRVLLLHKREILKLGNLVIREGYTLIPIDVHLDKGRAKVTIGLAKGKKLYDKKETLKERDILRSKEN